MIAALLLAGLPAHAAEWSPGRWLVDLGRDYGLASHAQPTDANATIVLKFMEAAARLEPRLGDAYYWQIDLLPALGRQAEALQALEKYVACVPDDHAAHLMLIANRLDELQTAQDRKKFCHEYLERHKLVPTVRSDLHRRIAEFYYDRGQYEAAKKEVAAALEEFSLNVAAKRLGYQISAAGDSPAQRVRIALEMISANPSQISLLWDLARLLDELSLHQQAGQWYAYAQEVFSYMNPGSEPPVEFFVDWARSQLDGQDPEAALKTCNKAIGTDPTDEDSLILMIHIATALNRRDLALAHVQILDRHYTSISSRVRRDKDAATAARMAWFYCLYAPSRERASFYARIADTGASMDAYAQRAVGFADLINERYDSAILRLKPLARQDQMAAIGLARAYLATGKKKQALEVLQAAVRLRYSGIRYQQIIALLQENGQQGPDPPDHTDVNQVLSRFDSRVLDFFRHPNNYISLEVLAEKTELEPGQPWELTFRLKNIGPFPITLGQEWMVVPKVMLSATTQGDRVRHFPHYLRFGMNLRQALMPDEHLQVTTDVDLGALRSAMFVTPQVTHHVTLTALLDPVRLPNGQWTHRLPGLTVRPLRFTRKALDASQPSLADLLSRTREGDPSQRAHGARLLAAILAEQDRLRTGVLSYKARKVDTAPVIQMLIDRLRDRSPLVRARTLEALRFVRPRGDLIKAMAPGLGAPDWLVRFMAMYSLAEMQGQVFAKVLSRAAESDPDPLLRAFAGAHLQRWTGPDKTSAHRNEQPP